MPTYEYQCANCGHQLEVFQKMSDQPVVDCPQCQTAGLKKLVSAAGFQLKGGGWYATDYRDKNKPKPAIDNAASVDTAKTASDTSTTDKKGSTDSGATS